MAYEMKVLPLAALRPDPNNPRREFGDLEAFAAEFDLNPYDPGEPFEPISGVVDGNVVRIVDGERRYRAMKAAGKVETCHVRVYDTMDEATACMVMNATDDKKPLTDEEAMRGVQQMLVLGVDEQAVDTVSRRAWARGMRRGMDKLAGNEKAEQMPLGWTVALGEVADCDEAVALMMEATPKRWETVAGTAARLAESRREERAVLEYIDKKWPNVPYVKRYPGQESSRSLMPEGHCHIETISSFSPEEFDKRMMAARAEHTDVRVLFTRGSMQDWGFMKWTAMLYGVPMDQGEADDEDEALKAEEEAALELAQQELDDQMIADAKARMRWIRERVAGGKCAATYTAGVLEGLIDEFAIEKGRAWELVFCDEPEESDVPEMQMTDSLYLLYAAEVFAGLQKELESAFVRRYVVEGKRRWGYSGRLVQYFETVEAMGQDGYLAEPWQDELADKLAVTFAEVLESR